VVVRVLEIGVNLRNSKGDSRGFQNIGSQLRTGCATSTISVDDLFVNVLYQE